VVSGNNLTSSSAHGSKGLMAPRTVLLLEAFKVELVAPEPLGTSQGYFDDAAQRNGSDIADWTDLATNANKKGILLS
jgi:hypothetical protein